MSWIVAFCEKSSPVAANFAPGLPNGLCCSEACVGSGLTTIARSKSGDSWRWRGFRVKAPLGDIVPMRWWALIGSI